MLNERAQTLLKTLIERYIADGQPVGSRALQQHSGLDISSATIRNVMSDLERLGLVVSPHTSAGRVPTASGYRLFVDTLLVTQPLQGTDVQQIAEQLQPDNPSRLILQASHLLSELTSLAGIVVTGRREGVMLHQIEFVRLGEARVLLILVMPDGEVENRVLSLQQNYSQSQLTEAGKYLNRHFAGRELSEVCMLLANELQQLHQSMSELMKAVLLAGQTLGEGLEREYVVSGEGNLLRVQDFSNDMSRLRGLFDLFEKKHELLQLLEASQSSAGIRIFIGSESGLASLDECSVITAPYTANNQVIGTLAVVGPKRMHYERVIPVVDIAARLLGNALTQN